LELGTRQKCHVMNPPLQMELSYWFSPPSLSPHLPLSLPPLPFILRLDAIADVAAAASASLAVPPSRSRPSPPTLAAARGTSALDLVAAWASSSTDARRGRIQPRRGRIRRRSGGAVAARSKIHSVLLRQWRRSARGGAALRRRGRGPAAAEHAGALAGGGAHGPWGRRPVAAAPRAEHTVAVAPFIFLVF
jgi:hypothetical protein